MLRSLKKLIGYDVMAQDGYAGHIATFIFDDKTWKITNMVVDTGFLFPGTQVIIPVHDVSKPSLTANAIKIFMNKDEIRTHKTFRKKNKDGLLDATNLEGSNIHDTKTVQHYQVKALNQTAGRVYDLVTDDSTWEIRYVIVNTRSWWNYKLIMLPTVAVKYISTKNNNIESFLSKEGIDDCEVFNIHEPVNTVYTASKVDYQGNTTSTEKT